MKPLIALALFLFSFSAMGQNFNTVFNYTDSINKGISIQNSYPKGGLRYIDPNGREYGYVIFWTCITNDTDSDLELTINFPIDSFTISSIPGENFHLYVPKEEMSIEKKTLWNYGLDLEKYLDNNLNKQDELIRTISPKTSSGFYVVILVSRVDKGGDFTLRAGLRIKDQKLIYRINDKEIECGNINLEHLKLKK